MSDACDQDLQCQEYIRHTAPITVFSALNSSSNLRRQESMQKPNANHEIPKPATEMDVNHVLNAQRSNMAHDMLRHGSRHPSRATWHRARNGQCGPDRELAQADGCHTHINSSAQTKTGRNQRGGNANMISWVWDGTQLSLKHNSVNVLLCRYSLWTSSGDV